MRIRAAALTAALTGAIALTGTTAAFAADPDPTTGIASNSPGVVSGNVIQIPVDVPVNMCGDTFNLLGFLNPAVGNVCTND